MTEAKKKVSIDSIERVISGEDRRAIEIRPDGSVVIGEREEAPEQAPPLTYAQVGLGDNY